MATDSGPMELRLAAVERQVQGLRWLSAVLAVVALALAAKLAQPREQTLRAPFRVLDRAGKPVLELQTTAAGSRLLLFGQRGEPSVILASDRQGGTVRASSATGQAVVELSGSGGGGAVSIGSAAGREGLRMTAGADGGHLDLLGRTGGGLQLGPNELDAGSIQIRDRAGQIGVLLEAVSGGGSLLLQGQPPTGRKLGIRNNRIYLQATPTLATLSSFYGASDDRTRPDVSLSASGNGGQLMLFDQRGRPGFSKP